MHKKYSKEPIKTARKGRCVVVTNRPLHVRNGYVVVQIAGKKIAYHRHVWEQAHGPLTAKQIIRQTCGNGYCCNLEHLSLGQQGADIEYAVTANGCHECTSHKPGRHGYPQARDRINSSGSTEHLHRIVWKRLHGGIAPGLVVRHKCDNRLCINPEHLELGTISENTADMVERGRAAKGVRNHNAKLTPSAVREIRQLLGRGHLQKDIAAKFGVAQTKISAIKTGQTWRHVQ